MIKKTTHHADYIIIGAGIFGLYAAKILAKKNKKIIILEQSQKPFARASTINQARVHNGYHYPRSYETAKKVADYYNRFNHEFSFAINRSFKHIYAISNNNSKTSGKEFIDFCSSIKIPIKKIDNNKYFRTQKVESAFEVEEPAFDFTKIRNYLIKFLNKGIQFIYNAQIKKINKYNSNYVVCLEDKIHITAPVVINATYAGINKIINLFNQKSFNLKYELCEVAFCSVSKKLQNLGFTVMDGEFFSIMPFGDKKIHSLTSVGYTPHETSYTDPPIFSKTKHNPLPCKMHYVKNCLVCSQSLSTAWDKMHFLYKEYLKPEYSIKYQYSMYEIKPILLKSEDDDSRPTIIKHHTKSPTLISVFSGKVSTIYDLEKYL